MTVRNLLKYIAAAASVLCLCIFCGYASAQSPDVCNYNVKLSNISLFSENEPARGGWITVSEGELNSLIADGMVEYFEKDICAELFEYTENDPEYSNMWEHKLISSEGAWEKGALGEGVTVAVIDSGANNHIELEGRIKHKYSYLDENSDVADPIGHGTGVAGVIAANRGDGVGFTGAAPRADLVILKVAGKDSSGKQIGPYISDISEAIYDAVDKYGCDVINMSLGTTTDNRILREAVNYALSKGTVVVAAAGNYAGTALVYPAALEGVIGAAAVDSDGERYSRSQYNESVYISAPGSSVNCLYQTSSYTKKTGTSFAAPYVSAVCAAMISADSSVTREEIFEAIKNTATDAGDEGYDVYYGHGIINFEGCINEIIKDSGIYISKVDAEDSDIPVFVTNTNASAAFFSLVVKNGEYDKTFIPMSLETGITAEISLAKLDSDENTRLFAVPQSILPAHPISKNAYTGLSAVSPTEADTFTITAKASEDIISVSSEDISIPAGTRANITVYAGETPLYIGEHINLSGLYLDIPADIRTLDGFGNEGVSITVSLWCDGTSGLLKQTTAVIGAKGDADCNGTINTDDLILLRLTVAGLVFADKYPACDFDADGSIDTDDIVAIRKYIAGT